MRNFINEFRDFIMRGNVMDLAVAFIMGAALWVLLSKLLLNQLLMT
ncbi:MscL family protein [Weissella confusa]